MKNRVLLFSVLGLVLLGACRNDSENLPIVQFTDSLSYAFESDDRFKINLTVEGEFEDPIVLTYQLTSGTATMGTDFAAVDDATLILMPEEESYALEVEVLRDDVEEYDAEDFIVSLASVEGGALGEFVDHTVLIQSNSSSNLIGGSTVLDAVIFGENASATYRLARRHAEHLLVTYQVQTQIDANGNPLFTFPDSIILEPYKTSFTIPLTFNPDYTGDYTGEAGAQIVLESVLGLDTDQSYIDAVLNLSEVQLVSISSGILDFQLDWEVKPIDVDSLAPTDVNMDICLKRLPDSTNCVLEGLSVSTASGEPFEIDDSYADGEYYIEASFTEGTLEQSGVQNLVDVILSAESRGVFNINNLEPQALRDTTFSVGDVVQYRMLKSGFDFQVDFRRIIRAEN